MFQCISYYFLDCFKVSGLISRSSTHFELILVQDERQGSSFQSSTCEYPVFPATFVEEVVFSSLCVLGSFVKDQLTVEAWFYVWIFYSNPLICLSVFVPIPCYSMELGERGKGKENDRASVTVKHNICEARGYKDMH
jgi:hypothetical protein